MLNRLSVVLTTAALTLGVAGGATAQRLPSPIAAETIPAVRTLPDQLPPSWIMIHDVNAGAIPVGRILFVDTGEKAEVRAQVGAGYLANYQFVPARRRLYVAETFYSRVNRGERSDVVSIYDTTTMNPVGEIALPTGKRAIVIPDNNGFQLVNDDQWGLVFNFTPAASVSVVDLVGERVLSEVEIPGCSMIYPLAGRNFATLCGDGTLLNVHLDEKGQVASTKVSAVFNDIDKDAMFMRPATVGKMAWFATFRGHVRGIDLSGEEARILDPLAIAAQPGGTPEWRPGGVQVIAADARGRLYLLMNPKGGEGTHKDGGTEVWVIDSRTGAVVRRVTLTIPALSIAVTHEATPKLAAIGFDKALHLYDPETGQAIRVVREIGYSPLAMVALP